MEEQLVDRGMTGTACRVAGDRGTTDEVAVTNACKVRMKVNVRVRVRVKVKVMVASMTTKYRVTMSLKEGRAMRRA